MSTLKRRWTVDEDALLSELVQPFLRAGVVDLSAWTSIAAAIEGRTPKQCRERWSGCLDPALNKSPWTEDEVARLLRLESELGHAWGAISVALGTGRSELAVRNQFYSRQRFLARHPQASSALPLMDAVDVAGAAVANAALRRGAATWNAGGPGVAMAVDAEPGGQRPAGYSPGAAAAAAAAAGGFTWHAGPNLLAGAAFAPTHPGDREPPILAGGGGGGSQQVYEARGSSAEAGNKRLRPSRRHASSALSIAAGSVDSASTSSSTLAHVMLALAPRPEAGGAPSGFAAQRPGSSAGTARMDARAGVGVADDAMRAAPSLSSSASASFFPSPPGGSRGPGAAAAAGSFRREPPDSSRSRGGESSQQQQQQDRRVFPRSVAAHGPAQSDLQLQASFGSFSGGRAGSDGASARQPPPSLSQLPRQQQQQPLQRRRGTSGHGRQPGAAYASSAGMGAAGMSDAGEDSLSPLGLVAAVAAAAAAAPSTPSASWDHMSYLPPPEPSERQWPAAQRGLGGSMSGGGGGGAPAHLGSLGNVTLGSLGSMSEVVAQGGGGGGGGGGPPRGPMVLPTHSPAEWGPTGLIPGLASSGSAGDALSDLVHFGGPASARGGAGGGGGAVQSSSWRAGSDSLGLSFSLSRGTSRAAAEVTARVYTPPTGTVPSSPGGEPGLSRGLQSLSVGQDI